MSVKGFVYSLEMYTPAKGDGALVLTVRPVDNVPTSRMVVRCPFDKERSCTSVCRAFSIETDNAAVLNHTCTACKNSSVVVAARH